MKVSNISEDDLFDDNTGDALTESVLNPNWSEPLELLDFLTQLKIDIDAVEKSG
jgi:hypothetical protein